MLCEASRHCRLPRNRLVDKGVGVCIRVRPDDRCVQYCDHRDRRLRLSCREPSPGALLEIWSTKHTHDCRITLPPAYTGAVSIEVTTVEINNKIEHSIKYYQKLTGSAYIRSSRAGCDVNLGPKGTLRPFKLGSSENRASRENYTERFKRSKCHYREVRLLKYPSNEYYGQGLISCVCTSSKKRGLVPHTEILDISG